MAGTPIANRIVALRKKGFCNTFRNIQRLDFGIPNIRPNPKNKKKTEPSRIVDHPVFSVYHLLTFHAHRHHTT